MGVAGQSELNIPEEVCQYGYYTLIVDQVIVIIVITST